MQTRKILALSAAVLSLAAFGEKFERTVTGAAPFPVTVTCGEPGGWRLEVRAVPSAVPDVGEVEIVLTSAAPAVPPEVLVSVETPQRDIASFWRPVSGSCGMQYGMLPNWGCHETSRLSRGMPLYAYLSASDRNRLTIASDEAKRDVSLWGGVREEGSLLSLGMCFFRTPEAPRTNAAVRVRFDSRDGFYADSIRDAADWIVRTAKLTPAPAPEAAFEPLYSTWYCFHQDVRAADIEAECALAAELGMRTLIVDDGWQTDDTNRGYAYCGDWQASTNRFPDMAAHVKAVHRLGLKYMVWYAVPFVGLKSANHARFRGKYLCENKMGAAVLDPRFPEVRDFLAGVYEKALRDWDLDGFKLDFIDSFSGEHERERGNGRDIETVPEAVDVLMKEIRRRLVAVKPDVLIEFRQNYVGPGIRQYGNMFRVADCPGNFRANRVAIAQLRLTSGSTAVHSDMLEWHPSERAEDAARYVLSSLFGTIQYSMMLRTLPKDHLRMIRHWVGFTVAHRNALQKGEFRPRHPELEYPLIEASDASERIFGVYAPNLAVSVPADGKTTYVVNATTESSLVLELAEDVGVEAFDTFGVCVSRRPAAKGLVRLACPVSGYLRLVKEAK